MFKLDSISYLRRFAVFFLQFSHPCMLAVRRSACRKRTVLVASRMHVACSSDFMKNWRNFRDDRKSKSSGDFGQ